MWPKLLDSRLRSGSYIYWLKPKNATSIIWHLNLDNEAKTPTSIGLLFQPDRCGELGEERPDHSSGKPFAAAGLEPRLLALVDVDYVHVSGHSVEGIGGRGIGVAADDLTLEPNLHGLLLHY
jgi:hypothetical protein